MSAVHGINSPDQVRGIVPVPPMEMKGNGTVLEHPWRLSARRLPVGPLPLVLGRRGAGLLPLPWVPQPGQRDRALGSGDDPAPPSSRRRSVPAPRPRRPLDSALVIDPSVIVPSDPAWSHSQERTGQRGGHRYSSETP